MKARLSRTLMVVVLLTVSSLSSAAKWPKLWAETLPTGTYLVLKPKMEGNIGFIKKKDLPVILKALRGDSQRAIQKRYPKAKFVTDAQTPNVIKVLPVMHIPQAFTPWSKVKVGLHLQLASGKRARVTQSLNIVTVANQGPEAANYAFEQVAKKLP